MLEQLDKIQILITKRNPPEFYPGGPYQSPVIQRAEEIRRLICRISDETTSESAKAKFKRTLVSSGTDMTGKYSSEDSPNLVSVESRVIEIAPNPGLRWHARRAMCLLNREIKAMPGIALQPAKIGTKYSLVIS